ncbi:hypothetical protein [Mannheimia varigena]|uniref:hypothetical protein n=1 Tax=Mannheimia varigena TaxID=85404 RepID=UPI00159DBDCF|nr:hypothetical protein [Mannheimia varigena]
MLQEAGVSSLSEIATRTGLTRAAISITTPMVNEPKISLVLFMAWQAVPHSIRGKR